jgi:hypothetical protein
MNCPATTNLRIVALTLSVAPTIPSPRCNLTYFPVIPALSSLSADMNTLRAKFSTCMAPAASLEMASLPASTAFIWWRVSEYQRKIPSSRELATRSD